MVNRQTASLAEASAIDSLVERAYSLRFLDLDTSLDLASTALERAERAEYPTGIARALVTLGGVRCRRMELDQAAADLQRALDIFETQPDPVGRARALSWQGSVAVRREDYASCARLWADALAGYHSAGDLSGEAEVLGKIGSLHMLLGDYVTALDHFAESRRIREELGDQHAVALSVNDTAGALAELGELESARQSFEEALALYRKTGSVSLEAIALANLGLCSFELGEYEPAEAYLEECLTIARPAGERLTQARALCTLGRVHHATGDPQKALAYFAASEELARSTGDRRSEVMASTGAARVLVRLGEAERAIEQLTGVLTTVESIGLQRFVADVHEALAEAHEAAGNLEGALRHHKAFHEVREKVQRAGAELRARHREELGRLRRVQQETELQALKAQLQPHFLFNALHSVSALIERNPSEATRAVTQLGDLLRLALVQSSDQYATLRAEIEFVSAYVRLEQVRYGHAFTFTTHVEPGLEAVRVPHLLLQPLAENAIRHGVARIDREGSIEIRAERTPAGRLRLTVRDNGVGLPPGWSPEASGVGLRNTRLRLQRLYGFDYEFRIGPAPAGGTRVEIVLPIRAPARCQRG